VDGVNITKINSKKIIIITIIFFMTATLTPFSNTIFGLQINKVTTDENILSEIQKALINNNAKWIAAETQISSFEKDVQFYLGANPEVPTDNEGEIITLNYDLPDKFDWRDVNGIDWTTPIRNQKNCGSCVAFGVLGALESVLQIKSNNTYKPDLSEANLFFCGDGSCNNGWIPTAALDRLKEIGVPDENCFQYQPYDMKCNEGCSNWKNKVVKIEKFGGVPTQSIKEYLITKGPLITSFVVFEDFFYYSSGIYEHVWGPYAGLHCVSIVGYNDIEDYWICKNSWGTRWGEDGWFKIKYRKCEIDLGVKYIELGGSNPPNTPNIPNGISTGIAGEHYSFTTSANDPDNNGLYYLVDWDDGEHIMSEGVYPNMAPATLTHSWSVLNQEEFNVRVKAIDVYGFESDWSHSFTIKITNNKPDKPLKVQGILRGVPEKEYEFTSLTNDPDGHQIYYLFDWGDGSDSGWIGPFISGDTVNTSHAWISNGQFKIKVKGKDIHGAESEWSDPTSIAMPKNILMNKFKISQLFF
jgi:C1A family cysteine protease